MIVETVGAALAGAAAVWAAGAYAPNSRIFGPVIGRGPRRGRSLYLTFDDGPSPSATPRVLDTLERHQVPATFFMVGRHVRLFPDLAREVQQAGHEIGNHTERHRKLHLLGPGAIRDELTQAHEAIAQYAGCVPRLFRAPHGYRNPFVTAAAARLGYRVIGWTFGVWDSSRPGADVIRRRVVRRLAPGAIILLHDGDGADPAGDRAQTAEALEGIITEARSRGYRFRPLADVVRA